MRTAITFWLLWVLAGGQAARGADTIEFNRDIRPILSDKCFACHGPDGDQREAGLRLDQRQSALDSMVIVPGDAEQSELVRRISSDSEDQRMPPVEYGKPLTADEVDRIRRWIAAGAKYQQHWSLTPLVRPAVPAMANESRIATPVDAFVLDRLQQEGLTFSATADPRTLIRRLSFDLTGLPPDPAAVQRFQAEPSPEAYAQLVEDLLQSPHYGERMAMYWLDLVRYADTLGYHGDQVRSVSPYRDYVIAAFNANKPFDEFTTEQLAGDLLPDATLSQQVASTYNRLNRASGEGGVQPKEYLAKYSADRVRTTAAVWLGSTLGCAECHDHKFDPFTAKDFYSFAAFFADIKEQGIVKGAVHIEQLPVPTPMQQRQSTRLDQQIAAAQQQDDRQSQQPTPQLSQLGDRLAELQAAKTQLEKAVVTTLVSKSTEPRVIRILPRGDWMNDSGEIVQPAVPHFLAPPRSDDRRLTRLDLAHWMTSPENPLVARTLVNRLWMLMFGQGLCRTVDDLGSQGEWPTHPELLDWLAAELVDSGWDIKHTLRMMVLSNTYQQSSLVPPSLRERDPYNRLWARQSRWRLDAEMVRDNALAVSGLLNRRIGGVSVKPYQPAGYWDQLNFPKRTYQHDAGASQYRRGIYTHWQRTFLHPSLLAFDAPAREECTPQRNRSNTPLQALVLLNDPSYVEAAKVLAAHVLQQGGQSFESRLAWAYRQVLARAPRREESLLLRSLYDRDLARYRDAPQAADAFLATGLAPVPDGLDHRQLAAWMAVTRALLNLHETIMRY